jgi:uncharacterized membrane protein
MKANLKQTLPFIYIATGTVGLVASFTLTYDKIHVLQNPNYSPGCNISPILSCGSVMSTEQASALGVPNTIFGLIAFSMLIMLGIVLWQGAIIKRRLWLLVNVGALLGFLGFVYLYFQAVFRIHAICPYCFTVWLIVPPILWYTTLYNLREGHIKAKYIKPNVKSWMLRHHGDILLVWYIVFFGFCLIVSGTTGLHFFSL